MSPVEQVARILEAVGELIYTARLSESAEPLLEFVGPGFERLVGAPVLIGASVLEIWHEQVVEEDQAALHAHLGRLRKGERSEVMFRLRGRDGHVRLLLERGFPRAEDINGEVYDAVVADVTEREREAERALTVRVEAERRSRLDPLTGLSNLADFSERLREKLTTERDLAIVLIDIDLFSRVNETFGRVVGDAVLRMIADRLRGAIRSDDLLARLGGEEFGVLLDPAPAGDRGLRELAERIRVALTDRPIIASGEMIDLSISAGAARATQSRDTPEGLLDAAGRATQLAKRRGRDQLRLSDEVAEHDLLMEEADAIRIAETMNRSVAAHERVPLEHSSRVAELAVAIAHQLGLGAAAIRRCRLGGWLHDVGKIAIPERIVQKAGPLDPEEWSIMRSHASIGASFVEAVPGLVDVAPVVRHHHERFDGTGYPAGLVGVSIPLEARIVAVADTYRAMRENRVYRASIDVAGIEAELDRVAGTQLDPVVVKALRIVISSSTGTG